MKTLLSIIIIIIGFSALGQSNYDLAREHFFNNQIDSARYFINIELAKNPRSEDYFLSGMIHESNEKNLRALADYEAVVRMDRQNLEAFFQKGLIYYSSASTEQAIRDFSYVIDNHSGSSTNAVYYSVDPYGRKGTKITSLQSMIANVYQYRGLAYQKIGDKERAMQDFNQSFSYDTIADFFINRANLFAQINQDEQAIDDLNRALELEPENYLVWYNLALLDESVRLPSYLLEDETFTPMLNLLCANAFESEAYALSASYATQALKANPKDELALMNRGKALMKTNNYKQARADFIQVLQITDHSPEALHLIGNSFFYEGNYSDAVGFYEQYLTIDQSYSNVWFNTAMAYLNQGEKGRACECLTKATALGMEQSVEVYKKQCSNQ